MAHIENDLKPGSIEETVQLLLNWCKNANHGLTRVEFSSEFSRKEVIKKLRDHLTAIEIPLHEIIFPDNDTSSKRVHLLIQKIQSIPNGVVSLSGFPGIFSSAFSDSFFKQTIQEELIRALNFNRENLVKPHLRQIWWLSSDYIGKMIHIAPDLNSWFFNRFKLDENIKPVSDNSFIFTTVDRSYINIDEARKRVAYLVQRFDKALDNEISIPVLFKEFINPAIKILKKAGAEKEANELYISTYKKIDKKKTRKTFIHNPVHPKIFISYTHADQDWAEWVAWEIQEAGYPVTLQAWDFRAGEDFVQRMEEALAQCDSVIAILSLDYLKSEFGAVEWRVKFAQDPSGGKRLLIPVRVKECQPPALLTTRIYIDLVGLNEEQARKRLVEGLKSSGRPTEKPPFPGERKDEVRIPAQKPSFPGAPDQKLFHLPHQRNVFFTGRKQILKKLHKSLSGGRAAAITHNQLLYGLGGIGKTQTAVEYAYRYRAEYASVFWVSAENETNIRSGFSEIAELLQLPEREAREQEIVIQAVRRWFYQHDGWLLIFDNADQPKILAPFLPNNENGRILITSRSSDFAELNIVSPLEMEKMDENEAREFLLKRTNRQKSAGAKGSVVSALGGNHDEFKRTEKEAADEIAKELGYLPLALEQAGAYIAEKRVPFHEYLEAYRKKHLEILELSGVKTGKYEKTVATTWAVNFTEVEAKSKAAADILRLSAFLHPDNIPLDLITKSASLLGSNVAKEIDEDNPLAIHNILAHLTAYSLIKRDIEADTYSIHRLVQEVIRSRLDQNIQKQWAECAVRAVNELLPSSDFENWSIYENLLPHALTCAELIEQWDFKLEAATRLLNQTGLYLKYRARYKEAEMLYRRALAIREKVLGGEHPDTATSLNNLAGLYNSQGRYEEAEPLCRRALAIREKVLGGEHPDTAISLNNLAGLYDSQGKYEEAEPLYLRALAICEKVLGGEHPDTAVSLNNLAGLYRTLRRYEEAEPLLRRAIAIVVKALGEQHPDTITFKENYELLLREWGKGRGE
ncbi:MAG: TIR domain-containing protein [Candidatus Omnitrophota bacterium]|nr:MAG: TIR domain-containing protein [Candidatus Omnitrophota bacterium]